MEIQHRSFSWIISVIFSVSLGTITYSFQINCMNNALKTMVDVFQISEKYKGFAQGALTSSVFFGAFLGSIFSYFLASKSIRKNIIILDILMILGSLLDTITNIYIFILGRVIAGIGCGMQSIFIPVYIKQFSPPSLFGQMGGLLQVIYSSAYLLTQGVGYIFDDELIAQKVWKYYFVLPSIFSLIRLLLMFFIVPYETPLFYFKNHEIEKAKELCQKIYNDTYIEVYMTNLENQCQSKQKTNLMGDKYKLRFYLAIFICLLYQFSGSNAILQFSTILFQDTTSTTIAITLTFIISVLKLLLYMITGLLSSKIGRRKPYLIGTFIILISNLMVGVFSFIIQFESSNYSYNTIQIMEWITIGFIFLFLFANFTSLGFLTPIYIPEIVPGDGVAISFQCFWLGSIIILFVFPIVKQQFGISYSFIFFTIFTLIGEIVLYKYAGETSQKNETQIDEMFKNMQEEKQNKLIPYINDLEDE